MNVRNMTFDSNGPEVRIRGNAHQVLEKYLAMARDASSQGDRIMAENYYQHAEHYFRLINATNQNNPNRAQQVRPPSPAEDQNQAYYDGEDGEGQEQGGQEHQDQEQVDETRADEAPAEEQAQPEAQAPEARSDEQGEQPVREKPRRGRGRGERRERPERAAEPRDDEPEQKEAVNA